MLKMKADEYWCKGSSDGKGVNFFSSCSLLLELQKINNDKFLFGRDTKYISKYLPDIYLHEQVADWAKTKIAKNNKLHI